MTVTEPPIKKPKNVFILAGRYGDLCLMLPAFHDEYKRTGTKTCVIVDRRFADLFEGTTYIDPIILDGHYTEIPNLIRQTKEKYSPDARVNFINPVQFVHGGHPPRHTPSFATEMWNLVGRPDDWDSDELPLVFDNRDAVRERRLIESVGVADEKVVLVSADGHSSKFDHKEELLELVRQATGLRVIDMAGVKADKPYDLLGLIDHAAALVSIDTMHLHLARASKTPVFALVSDAMEGWKGSAKRKSHLFHCRYGQFKSRKQELHDALHRLMNGGIFIQRRTLPVSRKNGYNPSMSGDVLVYRHHPNRDWRTQLAVVSGNSGGDIVFPPELHKLSLEDPRLFQHNDKLMMSYVVANFPQKPARCVVQYGELKYQDGNFHLINSQQPKHGRNDGSSLEKNWVFFSYEGGLYAIYNSQPPQQKVIRIEGEVVTEKHLSSVPDVWKWGEIHGGTAPVYFSLGKTISFFHSREGKDRARFRYHIGAIVRQASPPFDVLAISQKPILSGDEGYWRSGCHHWKPNVVFPASCHIGGNGEFNVAIGVNDCSCQLVSIYRGDLNL